MPWTFLIIYRLFTIQDRTPFGLSLLRWPFDKLRENGGVLTQNVSELKQNGSELKQNGSELKQNGGELNVMICESLINLL